MTRLQIPSLLLAASCSLLPARASAEAAPLTLDLTVGKPARVVAAHITNDTSGARLEVGSVRHTISDTAVRSVRTEYIELLDGTHITVIWADTDRNQRATVVGWKNNRTTIIASFISGLYGDPGERRGLMLRRGAIVDGRTQALGVAEQHEGAKDCTGRPVWIRTRWLNPATLVLGPASTSIDSFEDAAETPPVALLAGAEAPTNLTEFASQVQLLRTRWTDRSGVGAELDPLQYDPTLTSDAPTSASTDPSSAGASRALLSVSDGAARTHAIAVTVTPTRRARARQPAAIEIQGNGSPRFRVSLPPNLDMSKPVWIALPEPQAWTCIDLRVTAESVDGIRLRHVRQISDIDVTGGLEDLVGRVVTDDREGTAAASLLASLGERGLRALLAAWEGLGPRGKRRVAVAAATRVADSSSARQLLTRAAQDDDPDLRQRAVSVLASNVAHAAAELGVLAQGHGATADAATRALGGSEHPQAIEALLRALAAEAGSNRAVVRGALAEAAAHVNDPLPVFAGWLADAPARGVQAAAFTAVSGVPALHNWSRALWKTLADGPLEFEELWRVVNGCRGLPPDPEVDAWLTILSREDERWMVREAALQALKSRGAPTLPDVASRLLADDYPRVRAAAVVALAADDTGKGRAVEHLSTEQWPLVRATILEHATTPPQAHDILVAALRDPSMRVRIAAIDRLTALEDGGAWTHLAQRLTDTNEWPAVMSAVLRNAEALCLESAVDDLRPVLKRGLKPDAWAPDVNIALEAIELLGRLGTPRARELLTGLQGAAYEPAIRETATRALDGRTCAQTRVASNETARD